MSQEFNKKDKKTLRISLLIGLILGIAVDITLITGPLSIVTSIKNPRIAPGILTVVLVLQTATAILFAYFFTWVMIRSKAGKWLAILAGAVTGMLLAGISFGLSIGIKDQLLLVTGAGKFTEGIPHITLRIWLDSVASNAFGGFIYGGFIGLIFGAVAGYVIVSSVRKVNQKAS